MDAPIWYQCQTRRITLEQVVNHFIEDQSNRNLFYEQLWFFTYYNHSPYIDGYHFLHHLRNALKNDKLLFRYYFMYMVLTQDRPPEPISLHEESSDVHEFISYELSLGEIYRQITHMTNFLVGSVNLGVESFPVVTKIRRSQELKRWLHHRQILVEDITLSRMDNVAAHFNYLMTILNIIRTGDGEIDSEKILRFYYPKWSKLVIHNEEMIKRVHQGLESVANYDFLENYVKETRDYWNYPSFMEWCSRFTTVDNQIDAYRCDQYLRSLTASDRTNYIPTIMEKVTTYQVEVFVEKVRTKGFKETWLEYHRLYQQQLRDFITGEGLTVINQQCLLGTDLDQYPFKGLVFIGDRNHCYVMTTTDVIKSGRINPYTKAPINEEVGSETTSFLESWEKVLRRSLS